MTEFLSRGGVRLAYDIAGAGDSAMIFVHGWSCDRSYFAPQFEHFATGHAVAAMDLRGHGDSSQPGPGPGTGPGSYDVETMADDVLAVAEAAGFRSPVLLGHSLGAAVMRAMGEFDGASALGKVKVPVLSIGSAVPANESADLRSACPTITIGQTVGAGHFNQLEVPAQVNAMIGQFMAINQL